MARYIVDDGEPSLWDIFVGSVALTGCAVVLIPLIICGGIILAFLKGIGVVKEDPVPPRPPVTKVIEDPVPPPRPPIPTPDTGKRKDGNGGPVASTGSLDIRATQPVTAEAFIEVDGRRAADWPRGSRELTVTAWAGSRQVVYRSKINGVYYKYDFGDVVVPAGGTKQLTLAGVEPDPAGRW